MKEEIKSFDAIIYESLELSSNQDWADKLAKDFCKIPGGEWNIWYHISPFFHYKYLNTKDLQEKYKTADNVNGFIATTLDGATMLFEIKRQ